MRTITQIIIHCSATPEGRDCSVADIRRWHQQRGFKDIGYHFVVYRDGSIHQGRRIEQVGAHCLCHNAHSIGVCYIGGLAPDGKTPKDTRTPQQKTALSRLLRRLHSLFPQATLHGHREFAHKACPSFNVHDDYDQLFACH